MAQDGALPGSLAKENGESSPYYAVLAIAGLALVLALIGGLDGLVSGASLVFLAVFGTLNLLAWRADVGKTWITFPGMVLAFAALLVLAANLAGLV